MKQLQIVDENILKENIYISLKTKEKFSWNSWKKVSIIYDVTAIAREWETYEETAYYEKTLTINFVFSNFEWIVESVETT